MKITQQLDVIWWWLRVRLNVRALIQSVFLHIFFIRCTILSLFRNKIRCCAVWHWKSGPRFKMVVNFFYFLKFIYYVFSNIVTYVLSRPRNLNKKGLHPVTRCQWLMMLWLEKLQVAQGDGDIIVIIWFNFEVFHEPTRTDEQITVLVRQWYTNYTCWARSICCSWVCYSFYWIYLNDFFSFV